jgi:hypothetical protein
VGFDVKNQLLIRFVCIRQILQKKLEHSETVHQRFIDFKRAYDSVEREVLHNIILEFGYT